MPVGSIILEFPTIVVADAYGGRGIVYDVAGKRLENRSVGIFVDDRLVTTVTTLVDGSYTFTIPVPEPGMYTIYARANTAESVPRTFVT